MKETKWAHHQMIILTATNNKIGIPTYFPNENLYFQFFMQERSEVNLGAKLRLTILCYSSISAIRLHIEESLQMIE